MNSNLIYSRIFNRTFNALDCVRVVNPMQMAYYIKNEILPRDIYVSRDFKTGGDKLVMLFDKSETAELYKAWEAERGSQKIL